MTYNGSDKHKKALFEGKQDKLTAGDNITLTPLADGTVQIDAEGGGGTGTVTDVIVDGQSVVNQDGEAVITMPSDFIGATSQQAGSHGLVPAPLVTDKDKFLKGDGTWSEAGGGNVDDVEVNGESVVDANKVAQVFTHKEVTRAQYDALPDSKYSDGIIYCIKDGGSEKSNFFSPIIYSLAEREVGVWTDGKPLYEITKVFTHNTSWDGNRTNIEHGIANIDTCIDAVGRFINSSNKSVIYGGATRTNGDSYSSNSSYISSGLSLNACGFDRTYISVIVGSTFYQYSVVYDVVVTLRYTKTTDNPGTGKWTTSGVPAHHHSTDEQVIGTWIDGSTLYEKTYDLQDISNGYELDVSALNIGYLVDKKGTYRRYRAQPYLEQIDNIEWRTESPSLNNYFVCCKYNVGAKKFSFGIGGYKESGDTSTISVKLTIQYTKSS